ncbi:MAG: hypothetical protein ACHBNF_08575 [Chromatiales bacterium]
MVGQTELRILAALSAGKLANAGPALADNLRELKARVPATNMWDSVYPKRSARLSLIRRWPAPRKNARPGSCWRR